MTEILKGGDNKKENICTECLHSLQLLVDGEASKEQEEYFTSHLDECIPCYNAFNVDKSVKEFIQKKIEKKLVPASLIDKIKSAINQSV